MRAPLLASGAFLLYGEDINRPFLIGERSYLRPLEENDIDRCLIWVNDPVVTATSTLRRRNGETSILPRRHSRSWVMGSTS